MKRLFIAALISFSAIAGNSMTTDAVTLDNSDKQVKAHSKELNNSKDVQAKNFAVINYSNNSVQDNCKILVEQFFEGLLGRKPDPAGLEYWSNEIYKNNKTVSDVLVGMINSDEFKSKKYSNSQYVKAIFLGVQGREPDQAGLKYWTEILNAGNSRNYVLERTIESKEFKDKLKAMGIKNKGTINLSLIDKKGDVKALVEQFFEGFQGRKADQGGLNYWADEIIYERRSITNVIDSFVNSDEFKSKKYSNSQYVQALFKGILGREPDQAGLKYWTESLNKGNSRKYVLAKTIESSEFNNQLNYIGIKNKGLIPLDLVDKKGDVSGLVEQFFEGFQGRKPDKGGLNYWTDEIAYGRRSVANVIEGFVNSDEFKSRNYSNSQYVRALFKGILEREPDQAGLKYWTEVLDQGNSRKYVLAKTIESPEFTDKLNYIGIKNKGSISLDIIDKRGEVKALVGQFFEGFQGRKPDEGGLNYWTDEIVYGRKSVANVIEGFLNSDEFKNKNYSGEEYVKALYKGIQGRQPGDDESTYWLNQLINGRSKRYIASAIFDSQEFQNRLNGLGIKNKGKIQLSDQDIKVNVAKAKIKNAEMNLRSQPSLNSKVLTTMPSGSDVVVLGRAKGDREYYRVRYVKNGKIYEGYVSMYLNGVSVVEMYSDNSNNDFLGVLSEKYESNGNPGLISSGVGDYGGKSYGVWQFSSTMGSLDGFVNWLKGKNYSFYKKLVDARKLDNGSNCGPNFDKVWKDIAKNNYNSFYNLQHAYVKEQFYDKLVSRLMKAGDFSNILSSFAGRNVLWSTVVQHGVSGAYNIIAPLKNVKNVDSFISAVYKERGRKNNKGQLVHFISSSQAVQNGVASRFKREEAEALQMYKYEKNN